MENTIYLTEQDYRRLVELVQLQRHNSGVRSNIAQLGEELKRAKRVAAADIPAHVVTMNSRVRLQNLQDGTSMEITLVYPKDADVVSLRISILAPVGTAIIGCCEGDEIAWPAPGGILNYRIQQVIYQPEAAGDFAL